MKYSVVAVYDVAVGAFNRPWCARARGEALRIFQDEVNKSAGPESPLAFHPEHYQLFFLGVFDDQDGGFECVPRPEKLADAASLILPK